jgi:hypothetical protein
VIAALTIAVSLGLIAFGVTLSEGFARTLLLTIATAIFAIGGITFVYETYLRRTLTQDVLEIVQLDERLVESGVQAVSKRNSVDWHDFFSKSDRVILLPINPVAWQGDEWVHLTDVPLRRDASVEVYLPNPRGSSLGVVAARLGIEEGSLRADIQRILLEVERDCKGMFERCPQGRFTLLTYDGSPSYGLAVADDRVIISIPSLMTIPSAPQIVAFRFGPGSDNLIDTWVEQQFATIPDVGTHFTT